ncbi:MAG: cytochrome c oxidase subunit [Solirubrobacteraceae bacterium]|jgi:cytochrome c oxidase subunit 3|nr:cytochrome c oxidase subunit [Solirubrobacteraceae bacterium]
MEAATIAQGHADHEHEHHGPPEAHRSSRVEPQLLGMLLFIISEVMVFGAFFTAYFFIRVVNGDKWFPVDGHKLPVAVAFVNTCILVSSSFTLHWAEHGVKTNNRFALKAGILSTFLLGLTFLFVQVNEYVHIGFAPHDFAQGSVFYGLTGLHGAHVAVGLTLLLMVVVRAWRGHYSPDEHRGVEVPGIYWHFVDVMWIVVFLSVYVV